WEQANNAPAYVESVLAQSEWSTDNAGALRETLLTQVTKRADLIDQVNTELSGLLSEAIILQLAQTRLQATASALKNRLEEQMFWVPSSRPIGHAWLRTLPRRLSQQITGIPWRSASAEFVAGL